MKKIKKIIIVMVSIFLIICQLNVFSYAYTISDVKNIIGFKVIENGNEPKYDIKIDANDLINNEKLPCIKATIETVLYSGDGILNVNFFNRKTTTTATTTGTTGTSTSTTNQKATAEEPNQTSTNKKNNSKKNNSKKNNSKNNTKNSSSKTTNTTSEKTSNKSNNNTTKKSSNNKISSTGQLNKEEYISNLVKLTFKVCLAISMMAMLTLLIYIGLTTVSESISDKIGFLKFLSVFNSKNPQRKLKQKRAVEAWFKSMILLTSVVLIINLVTGGIDYLTSFLNDKKIESNAIGVYVVNAKKPTTTLGTTKINSSDLSDIITEGKWAVYAKNLSSNKDIEKYNVNDQMSSASVMKLFIAAAAYQKQEDTRKGSTSSDNILDQLESNRYIVDEARMKKMISESSNSDANYFIKSVKQEYIQKYLEKNNYTGTKLNRNFGETTILDDKDNYTTARDVGRLLEKIYKKQCMGAENILNYMKMQTRRNKIPAGVPSGIEVANKTGELSPEYKNYPVENDAAIVYKQDANYVLVILSTGTSTSDIAIEKIKKISERIYAKAGGISEQATGTATDASITNDYSSILDTSQNRTAREKIIKKAQTVSNSDSLKTEKSQNDEVWVEEIYRTVLEKGEDSITKHLCAYEAGITCNNGIGPYTDSNNIIPGAAVFSYKSSSKAKCGDHDVGHIGIYIGDGKIASYLGSGIDIRSIEDWKKEWSFDGWGWITGTEYLGEDSSANDISNSEGNTFNYYFKTGIEGLMMFKSQYNWKEYAGKNFSNIIGGSSIAIIKIALYVIFFVRMVILAFITAFSPIIILIDAFKKLSGSEGYLNNWGKLFLFLMFSRPVIAFLYYIFVINNPYLAVEFPGCVVIINIVIFTVTCISIKMMIDDLRGKKRSNKIRSRA